MIRTVLVVGIAAFFALFAAAAFGADSRGTSYQDRDYPQRHRNNPVTVTVGDHTGINVVITGDRNVVQVIIDSQGGVRETAIASSAKRTAQDCDGRMQAYYSRTNDWVAELDRR